MRHKRLLSLIILLTVGCWVQAGQSAWLSDNPPGRTKGWSICGLQPGVKYRKSSSVVVGVTNPTHLRLDVSNIAVVLDLSHANGLIEDVETAKGPTPVEFNGQVVFRNLESFSSVKKRVGEIGQLEEDPDDGRLFTIDKIGNQLVLEKSPGATDRLISVEIHIFRN